MKQGLLAFHMNIAEDSPNDRNSDRRTLQAPPLLIFPRVEDVVAALQPG